MRRHATVTTERLRRMDDKDSAKKMQDLGALSHANFSVFVIVLTLLHSKRPKLHTILAFLSAIGLKFKFKPVLMFELHFNFIIPFLNSIPIGGVLDNNLRLSLLCVIT